MATEQKRTPTAKQQYWLEHLRACTTTGQSMSAYARQHGLNRYAFQSGKSQLVRLGLWPAAPTAAREDSGFVRIEVSPPESSPGHRLHLGGGLMLELAEHSEPSWIAQLLRALQEAA